MAKTPANDDKNPEQDEAEDVVFGDLLSEMELETEAEKRRFGAEKMEAMLGRLPPENDKPKKCPRCGKRAKLRRKGVARTVQTLSGDHVLKRNYHVCTDCELGFYPQDLLLGLPERGALSPELEKRVLDFGLNEVYEECERRWELHYGYSLSSNQFRQVAKRIGRDIQACDAHELQLELFPEKPRPANTLYTMVDGSMICTRAGWKEAKLGVVLRDDQHLPRTLQNKRGIVSNARYTAAMDGPDEFKKLMSAVLDAEQAHKAARRVWIADGARELWHLAASLAPDAIQILDWYHAIENGMRCATALLGEDRNMDLKRLWKHRIENLLGAGDIKSLTSELMDCLDLCQTHEQKSALNDLVRYYRNNADRMKYNEYLELGLMIGSGIVESAHRHVLQKRMKLAGQRWELGKANAMARMRSAYRTAGPHQMHRAVRAAYRKAHYRKPDVSAPRKKMRASNR